MQEQSSINAPNNVAPQQEIQTYGVINVKEMKKKPVAKKEDVHLWYNQLRYWLALSLIPSIISLVTAYFLRDFIYILPVFPLIALIAWSVRKFFRDRGLDNEEWLR